MSHVSVGIFFLSYNPDCIRLSLKHEAHSSQVLAIGQWILDLAFLDISSSSTPTKFSRHVDYIGSVGRRRKEEVTLIKSRDSHLAGGENKQRNSSCFFLLVGILVILPVSLFFFVNLFLIM